MSEQKKEILEFVEREKNQGRQTGEILKNLGVPRSSFYRWKKNGLPSPICSPPSFSSPRSLTPEEKESIDRIQEKDPHLRHRRIQGILQQSGIYLSPSAVYQHLKSQGKVEPYERRLSPLKQPFYEVIRRNTLWGSDWTKLRIGGIRWYLLTIIDFFSRAIIAWEIVPSVNASHVKAIYQRGLRAQNIPLQSLNKPELRVDQGSPNTSLITREFFEILGAELSFARVRRPTDNAITERFYGSFKQEEFYLIGNYPDEISAREEIGKYVDFYNQQRPHQALWNFTPAYIHEVNSKTKIINELKEMKRKTQERRRQFWKKQQPKSSSLIFTDLSHLKKT